MQMRSVEKKKKKKKGTRRENTGIVREEEKAERGIVGTACNEVRRTRERRRVVERGRENAFGDS